MTIGQKVHTTLANLEGALADMKSFSLETQDQNAKQMFNDYATKLDGIVQGLKGRTNYIESQEPAYKARTKM